jgi:hypothetical protein
MVETFIDGRIELLEIAAGVFLGAEKPAQPLAS